MVAILFHSLFLDEHEILSGKSDPQQGVTVSAFRRVVEHFVQAGYIFVSPEDIKKGLSSGSRYILITFDDGYFNNVRALPVLEEFDIPAVFFISTDHVDKEKSFWWDALYRELKKMDYSDQKVARIINSYKMHRTEEIETKLAIEYGPKALQPLSDTDRPFTIEELKMFAKNKHVFLGNHTSNHAILPNYTSAQISDEIVKCQNRIEKLTGKIPLIIAYPSGRYTDNILVDSENAGLALGITTEVGQNVIPIALGEKSAMTLKRFIIYGNLPIKSQCLMFRSKISLYLLAARVKFNFRRPTIA